jgi:hypothetical protein
MEAPYDSVGYGALKHRYVSGAIKWDLEHSRERHMLSRQLKGGRQRFCVAATVLPAGSLRQRGEGSSCEVIILVGASSANSDRA